MEEKAKKKIVFVLALLGALLGALILIELLGGIAYLEEITSSPKFAPIYERELDQEE